ncbi:MAG: S26 family signal peptidase, partial [Odoribacter sp.]|nr:S26 family signal peptidase [Odoribacter sp.]
FMGGDACHNSQDSRYFGPIPDDFIAGRATRIYWSKDKYFGDIRYDRILKKI